MSAPIQPATKAVICHRCTVCVAEGDDIEDGQPIITKYADTKCKDKDCPSTSTAVAARLKRRASG